MNAPWPHGDPQAVVRAILSDPRFSGTTTAAAPQPALLDRLFAWIGHEFSALMKAIGTALGAQSGLNTVLAYAVLAAIVAGLVYLAYRVFMLPGRRYRARSDAAVTFDGVESSADMLALARTAARDERWHDAAAALLRAALRTLDERGRLPFDPARTAGDVGRILRDPAFDAFEREATTALFAENGATRERYGRLDAAYAATFGDAP